MTGGVGRTSALSRAVRFAAGKRVVLVCAAVCVGGTVLGIACGGTTGREGLTTQRGDAAVSTLTDAAVDGTVGSPLQMGDDAGAFDVFIEYADRQLPEASAPPSDAGGEAGRPWPNCPPFLPVGADGKPVNADGGTVPLDMSLDQIPAAYDNTGSVIPAPDGSACASYGWLGSTAIDHCMTSGSNGTYIFLPPCNWVADGGVARAGPGAGHDVYDLCLDLYACMMRTGCVTITGGHGATCLCGDASANDCAMDPKGPCAVEELSALQCPRDSASIQLIFQHYKDPSSIGVGTFQGAATLNDVFQKALSLRCFSSLDGGP
jgi:hypothetical protein